MEGDAEVHALSPNGGGPLAQQVAVGTDVDRVPWLVTRVPQVIVVVMHPQDKEVTGTGLVEEAGIGFGVEMFGIPGARTSL